MMFDSLLFKFGLFGVLPSPTEEGSLNQLKLKLCKVGCFYVLCHKYTKNFNIA